MSSNYPFEPPAAELIEQDVERALCEDLGELDAGRDATGRLLGSEGKLAEATVYSNSDGVLCGGPWFEMAFALLDRETQVNWKKQEGDAICAGDLICTLDGKMQALLAAERTALNFLQLLSGVASRARQFAKLVEQHSPAAGPGAGATSQILDTRKTLPGLRMAQKYAVRVGGCHNHRFSLQDAVMIKENHILAAGGIETLLRRAALSNKDLPIIVEVETLAELTQVLQLLAQSQTTQDGKMRVDVILLDNFKLQQVRQALQLREEIVGSQNAASSAGGKGLEDSDKSAPISMPAFEVSGSVTGQQLPALIELGVERISVGQLTKDVAALDFSLRFKQT